MLTMKLKKAGNGYPVVVNVLNIKAISQTGPDQCQVMIEAADGSFGLQVQGRFEDLDTLYQNALKDAGVYMAALYESKQRIEAIRTGVAESVIQVLQPELLGTLRKELEEQLSAKLPDEIDKFMQAVASGEDPGGLGDPAAAGKPGDKKGGKRKT